MAKLDLASALQAVEPETKAAQIRQVMPIIEQQLKAGVRRQAILNVLKEQGIEISMETLKSYLYRYRKSVKAGTVEAPASVPSLQSAVVVPEAPAENRVLYRTIQNQKIRIHRHQWRRPN